MSEQSLKACKITIGKSSEVKIPRPGDYSIWIEDGVWYAAETVDPSKFGPHDYARAGIGLCRCGCEMHSSSSWGEVDPFGACPMNPLNTRPTEQPSAGFAIHIVDCPHCNHRFERPCVPQLQSAKEEIERLKARGDGFASRIDFVRNRICAFLGDENPIKVEDAAERIMCEVAGLRTANSDLQNKLQEAERVIERFERLARRLGLMSDVKDIEAWRAR